MKRTAIASLALLVSAGVGLAEQVPGSAFKSGNWSGGAFTDDQTGGFSHCAVSASFVSGDILYFSVNSGATISIAVQSHGLRLTTGASIPVTLSVDRRTPYHGTAYALGPDFAGLTITEFEQALDAFKRGRTLVINSPAGRGTYDLTGTFRALEAAKACALRYYGYAAKAKDKTAMFQLASMVVSELGLKSFRFLNEAELAERGWENAVAWISPENGVAGVNLIIPRNSTDDLRATDPEDTQFLAQGCTGDYVTSARSITLEDGVSSARELRLVCRTGEGDTETYLSKFFSGTQIVYNVLQFTGAETAPAGPARQEQSQTATLRVASVTLE